MRETLIVILSECEESAAVVRKAVRCYPSNRFFTLCHYPIFRLFHKAFLLLFRMTGVRKGCRLLVSGIKAWGDAGNGTEGRYEYLLLSTDFFLYFLYTKGRSVLFL